MLNDEIEFFKLKLAAVVLCYDQLEKKDEILEGRFHQLLNELPENHQREWAVSSLEIDPHY